MRLLLIPVIFIFVHTSAAAQKKLLPPTQVSKNAGINFLKNSPIKAIQYSMPARINSYYLDTLANTITLELREKTRNERMANTGNFLIYDLATNSIKWSKELRYHQEFIRRYKNNIVRTTAEKSFALDISTGKPLWESTNSIYHGNPEYNVGIGYKSLGFNKPTNILQGIDLTTGEVKWQKAISKEFGWNDAFYLDDSTLLIASSGLHTIDVNTGQGWNHFTNTAEKDYTAAVVGTTAGITIGLITGYYTTYSGHQLIRDISSNVLIEKPYIYHASKSGVSKLDLDGNLLWSATLPQRLTSKSYLFTIGEKLYMINLGQAVTGMHEIQYGTPYIASFNLNTGENYFIAILEKDKQKTLKDYYVKDNELILLYDDHISIHSLQDGALIKTKFLSDTDNGKLSYFISEHVYTKVDSTYQSLVLTNPSNIFVLTDTNKILRLNSAFDIEDEILRRDYFTLYLENKSSRFLAGKNVTLILNKSGQAVASVDATSKAHLINNTLYDTLGNVLFAIDLSDVLEELK